MKPMEYQKRLHPSFGGVPGAIAYKSSSGAGGTTTQQTNSSSGPPNWAQMASQQLYGGAQSVAASTAPTQIAGVAPLTAGQNQTISGLLGNVGSANPLYTSAEQGAGNVMGYQPSTVSAGSLNGADLSGYENPFTSTVINAAQNSAQQQLLQGINGIGAGSIGSGAFGGSRQGVQEGAAAAQSALNMGNLTAGLQSQNFQQAQAQANADLNRGLTAQTSNQQAGLAGAGLNLSAANSLSGMAGQQAQTYLNQSGAALAGQGLLQGNQQQVLQQQADQANANNMAPYQRIQMQQGVLSGVPLATNSTSTTQGQQTQPQNTGMSILGGLGAAAGIAGTIFGGPIGGAIGSAAGGLLSKAGSGWTY